VLGFKPVNLTRLQIDLHEQRSPFDLTAVSAGTEPSISWSDSAGVALTGAQPLLFFPILSSVGDSWAHDPSVVFHEIAHAALYMLYTKLPVKFDENGELNEVFLGIEEGFCDYFAAMMMEQFLIPDFSGKYGVGGLLSAPILEKQAQSLPRLFGFRGFSTVTTDRYQIGVAWAHFLWRLRGNIASRNNHDRHTPGTIIADRAIMSAFFKPRFPRKFTNAGSPDDSPVLKARRDVIECYLFSLRKTLAIQGVAHPDISTFARNNLLLK
jgi:hypothetical protein